MFTVFSQNSTAKNTGVLYDNIPIFSKYLLGNVKLELSVLMLSHTVEGGHLHQLFPNVNSGTAKYTLPCKLGSVHLAVSLLTLGWNCTRCTLQSSSPQPLLCLGFGELDCKVHLVQFQLKSVRVHFQVGPVSLRSTRPTWKGTQPDLSQSRLSRPPSTVRLNLK